jgi:hypothetical protein
MIEFNLLGFSALRWKYHGQSTSQRCVRKKRLDGVAMKSPTERPAPISVTKRRSLLVGIALRHLHRRLTFVGVFVIILAAAVEAAM